MTATGPSSIFPGGPMLSFLFLPSLLLLSALIRECGILPVGRLVDDFAADHCDQDFGLADFRGLDLEQIAVEQDEVG